MSGTENGNGTALAKPEQNPLVALLEKNRDRIKAVASRALNPEKLVKLMGVAASRTPKLLQCTPLSLLQSCMTLAELGLTPGVLGEAYLIPFDNRQAGVTECQLVIGFRGLRKLAMRSGLLSSVTANVVYEGDQFEVELGTVMKLTHVPTIGKPRDDKAIIGAYAVARYKDSTIDPVIEWMDRNQIDRIRAGSKAGKFGPWVDHYGEMARKTVLRRICKNLDLTPEAEEAVAKADQVDISALMPDADEIEAAGRAEAAQSAGVEQANNRISELRSQLPEAASQEPAAEADAEADPELLTTRRRSAR